VEFFKPGKVYDFMKVGRLATAVSLALSIASLLAAIVIGPNYGVDFKGGTEVELAFSKAITAGELRDAAASIGFGRPEIITVADPANANHYLIRLQQVSALDASQEASLRDALCFAPEGTSLPPDRCPDDLRPTEVKLSPGGDHVTVRYLGKPPLDRVRAEVESAKGISLRSGTNSVRYASAVDDKVDILLRSTGDLFVEALRARLGADVVPTPLRVEWLGPKAGAQLRNDALRTVAIAMVMVSLYVSLRFDLTFIPGCVIALLHDVLIVLGAYVLARREFSVPTIAALLTVVGYSLADKVIVYDRIRENVRRRAGPSFKAIVNISVSQTLGRTVVTSGTVLLSVIAFLVWGTGVLKDFGFALVVGVLVATFSSIFVAAPVTEWASRKFTAPRPVAARG
jgi:preprotein translocase subunit SecF